VFTATATGTAAWNDWPSEGTASADACSWLTALSDVCGLSDRRGLSDGCGSVLRSFGCAVVLVGFDVASVLACFAGAFGLVAAFVAVLSSALAAFLTAALVGADPAALVDNLLLGFVSFGWVVAGFEILDFDILGFAPFGFAGGWPSGAPFIVSFDITQSPLSGWNTPHPSPGNDWRGEAHLATLYRLSHWLIWFTGCQGRACVRTEVLRNALRRPALRND